MRPGLMAEENNTSQPNAGAVYVFTRNGTAWSQQAYVKASNTDNDDKFGYSVALSGDTLAVGSTGEADATGAARAIRALLTPVPFMSLSAYGRRTWTQQAYVKASNPPPASDDNFGWSLALLDDTLVVGVPGQDSNAGAGYLFSRSSGTWSPLAYFTAAIPRTNDGFGWSLALTDDMLAVGAPGEDSGATGIDGNQNDISMVNAGAVYTFQ